MKWQLAVGLSLIGLMVLTGRITVGRAGRLLTGDQRKQVVELYAMPHAKKALFLVGFLWLLVLAIAFAVHSNAIRLVILVPILIGTFLVAHVNYLRGLRRLNLPPSYVRAWQRGQAIMYTGFLALLAVISYGMWRL